MAPRPASPRPASPPPGATAAHPGATNAPMEAGLSYGYPPMTHGALMLFQAAIAMRDFPKERARNARLEDANENLQMEIQKLKQKEVELKQKIEELKISKGNLEGDLKGQVDQVKKLEASLKAMSEKKNHGALNSANLATSTTCNHCLEHVARLNALTEENEKMKERIKLLTEAFTAGNDQA